MHCELLRCLALLAVVRLLVLAAAPAPAPPFSRAGRSSAPGGAAGSADAQLLGRAAVTRPARVRRPAAGRSEVTRTGDVTCPGPAGTAAGGAAGTTRRGVRSRRRGARGGRIWRARARPGQLYVGQLNIQSLKPKLLALRHDIAEHEYDLVILNETWMKPSTHSRLIPIPGYHLSRRDRPDGKGYGGVAIATREPLEATTVEPPDQPIADSKIETLWVQVQSGPARVMVCAVYRPPIKTQARVTADLAELEQQLQYVLTRHSGPIVIAGDININMGADSTAAEQFRQLMSSYSLQQHITEPTFRASGSTIDVIVTSQSVDKAGVVHCDYSPHNWSRAMLSVSGLRPQPCTFTTRCWSKFDAEEANRQIAAVDWSPVFASDSPEEQWDYLLAMTRPILDTVIPEKRLRVRNPVAPPITDATKDLMARRRAALGKGDRESYKQLNRQAQAAIRRDTREELDRRVRQAGPGAMWRSVQPIVASKRSARSTPSADADAMNKYFVEVGPKTARRVDSAGPELPVRLPRVATGGFRVSPICPDDLRRVVGRMRSSTACGADGLCVRFVKLCMPSLCHILTHIVNTSLVSSNVPRSWKLTIVHPIQKSSRSTETSNYRPISILPTIAKITERVVYEQLHYYFSSHHLFSHSQHGFRPNHSTDTALLTVTDKVFSAMDHSDVTLLCLLDLSKCFDVIPHDRLLDKLRLYGVDVRWFDSYLTDHYQKVRITAPSGEHFTSRPLLNPIGTYQGSALGPLLYSIYANDLPLFANDANIVQYADDTQILVSGRPGDIGSLVASMEQTLSHLSQWFGKNGLKINAEKTQLIVLGSRQNIQRLAAVSINFMGATVVGSPTVRNLGVVFDQRMTFAAHIDDLVRRCTGALCGLSHSRHCLPQATVIKLVEGLVISPIRYCLTVYGTTNKTQLCRLQRILNFGARVISGRRKYDHISDVLRELNWLTAENLFMYHSLTLLNKIRCISEPETLAHSLIARRNIHHHSTRQSDQLVTPQIRSESGKRRFLYSIVTKFNGLPAAMRDMQLSPFKGEMRKWLLRSQFGDE